MTQTVSTAARIESTDVRFSMRSLLLMTVAVAVVAMAAGQCIRGFDPEQKTRAAAAWAGWLLLVIGWLTLIARKRVRAEKVAGRTIVRLPIYGMNPVWRIIARYLFSGYLMTFGTFTLIFNADRAARSESVSDALLTALYPDAIFLARLTAICAALWWWPRDIRLCENGVLADHRLIRWSDATQRWDPDHDAVTVYGPDQSGAELHFDMIVPEQQRASVEALFKEKSEAV